MLTHNALLALHESLRDQHVLTAYVDTSATDPALQRAWRLQLDHALDEVEAGLDGTARTARTARAEFVKCRRALEAALASSDIGRTPGWVGFATADGAVTALSLPIAAPTRVAWDQGAALGPYIRAQKHAGDVVVAVVDAKHATLYRYRAGALQRVERVRSHHPIEHADHLGTPARNGFHTGTRGRTARDAAQRTLRYGRDRMLSEAANRAMKLLNSDGWIVVAGVDAVASKLVTRLDALAPGRVARASELDVHSSEPEIATAAREHALALSAAFDCKRLADVAEAAGAHRLGVMGVEETAVALEQACVRTLYFTPDYLVRHGDEAERAIRVALDQRAAVWEVEREAAAMLDERGGIAAALRFRAAALSTVSQATEARYHDVPLS
jgi:hypothetical protein